MTHPAPLDLAALRGLLEKAADYRNYLKEADRYERQHVMDKIRECEVGILSALPALLDFAAESERVVRAAKQLVSDLIDCNPSEIGPILTATWETWRVQQERLLSRLAGNGEAR